MLLDDAVRKVERVRARGRELRVSCVAASTEYKQIEIHAEQDLRVTWQIVLLLTS